MSPSIPDLITALDAAVAGGDPMLVFDATAALAEALGEAHGRVVASALARAYLDREMARFAARNLAAPAYRHLALLASCA